MTELSSKHVLPSRLPTRAQRTAARMADSPRVRGPFEAVGDLVDFGLKGVAEIPVAVRKYPEEAVRQAALLIRSNAPVMFFMMFTLGAVMSVMGTYLFDSIGLDSYVAAIPSVPVMRGPLEMVFGWVFAAKAGCGIVAELGAMRISEEVDAVEVMGIRPVPYLVSNRILAVIVTIPVMFAVSLVIFFLSMQLFCVTLLHAVSSGGYVSILYLFQRPKDFAIAVVWSLVVGLIVVIVSSFYGYNAKGGPVGVGRATAQSMLVNLVLISGVSFVMAIVFYGGHGGTPIGT